MRRTIPKRTIPKRTILKRAALGLLLGLLLGPVLVIGLWFGIPPVTPWLLANNDIGWTEGLYRVKARIMAETPPGRLVVVGGSAAHFAVDAARLGRLTGARAVGLGAHAGLQLPYLLDRADRLLAKGDRVLLMVEYPLYGIAAPFSAMTAFYTAKDDKRFWTRLRPDQLWPYLHQFDLHVVARALAGNLDHWRFAPLASLPGIYAVATIDPEDGTERGNTEERQTEAMRARLERTRPFLARPLADTAATRAIDRFLAGQRAKGVEVLAVFPPLLHLPDYDTRPYRDWFAGLPGFWAARGVPVLGTPEQFLFPRARMFDTEFHLNREGQADYTEKLAALVRAQAGSR